MLKVIIFLVLNIWILKYAEAICNHCNTNNGIACISKTEFHMCFGGFPNTTTTFSCLNPNEICTKHATICMDSTLTSGLVPACGDTTNCGKCETLNDGAFTCTSRSTFTMCMDNKLTDIRNSCPAKQICDITIAARGLNPCVPECKESTIKFCDLKEAIDEPIITTQAPTTTTEEITTNTEEISTAEEITTTTVTFKPTPPIITNTTNVATNTTEIVTTTTELPTTELIRTTTTMRPTTTTQNPANVCSQQTAVGRYPHPNDTTCRKYVFCSVKNNMMQTTILECPGQLYFNSSTSLCGKLKPEGCI